MISQVKMHFMLLSNLLTYKTKTMKKTILLITIALFVVSCSNIDETTIDGKLKKAFAEWAKDNLKEKHSVQAITFDTVGCPMDFMYSATILGQTVGGSGQTEAKINKGSTLIALESVVDSSLLTKNILIAKIQVKINDSIGSYYVGMRGDSICTAPQEHGYDALIKTHIEGEQYIYDACYEILNNLSVYAKERGGRDKQFSKEEFYDFWIALPPYQDALSR